MKYTKGSRVATPYGLGTVRAFERITESLELLPDSDEDPGSDGRIQVTLDDPTRWLGGRYGDPYMYRRELTAEPSSEETAP